jgi:hypothetical protein
MDAYLESVFNHGPFAKFLGQVTGEDHTFIHERSKQLAIKHHLQRRISDTLWLMTSHLD